MTLEYEAAPQDGYLFRAVEVWPVGARPDLRDDGLDDPSEAYESGLTVTWDETGMPGDASGPSDE